MNKDLHELDGDRVSEAWGLQPDDRKHGIRFDWVLTANAGKNRRIGNQSWGSFLMVVMSGACNSATGSKYSGAQPFLLFRKM